MPVIDEMICSIGAIFSSVLLSAERKEGVQFFSAFVGAWSSIRIRAVTFENGRCTYTCLDFVSRSLILLKIITSSASYSCSKMILGSPGV